MTWRVCSFVKWTLNLHFPCRRECTIQESSNKNVVTGLVKRAKFLYNVPYLYETGYTSMQRDISSATCYTSMKSAILLCKFHLKNRENYPGRKGRLRGFFPMWRQFIDIMPNTSSLLITVVFSYSISVSLLIFLYNIFSCSSSTLLQLSKWCFQCIVFTLCLSVRKARPAAEHVIHLHLCLALRLRHIFAATQGFSLRSGEGCCNGRGAGWENLWETLGFHGFYISLLPLLRGSNCAVTRWKKLFGFTSHPPIGKSPKAIIYAKSRYQSEDLT